MQAWSEEVLEKIIKKYSRSAALAAEQGIIPYQGAQGRWIGSPWDGNS